MRKYTRVTYTEEMGRQLRAFVKKRRPRALQEEEKLDILAALAHQRDQELAAKANPKPGRPKAKWKHLKIVAKMLMRSKNVVQAVWKEYVERKEVTLATQPGNSAQPMTRVPRTKKVTKEIQEFVRERRKIRQRTVARDVLEFLVEKGYLWYDSDNRESHAAALRSVQRLLKELGYQRGKKKNVLIYRLKDENVVKRDKYVMRMMSDEMTSQRRIVYMDESYIHKNYARHEDSLYDPNDEQDLQVKAQHKGQRYCFIGAIIDADHTVPEEKRTDVQKAHFMHDTLDIFEGGKKQTKDYHSMFNHDYFVCWMEKLLQALEARGVQNAVIVMDNAKYHKKVPADTPKFGNKKATLQEACVRYGIAYAPSDTKAVLWEKLAVHVQAIQPVIVKMAAEKGHEVLFSPPHHSDLQPIELIWAIVKGDVGRQYTTETTFAQVLQRLRAAFDALTTRTVHGCIEKANKHLEKLHKYILDLDGIDEEPDDGGDDDAEDDDGDEDNEDASDSSDDDSEDPEDE